MVAPEKELFAPRPLRPLQPLHLRCPQDRLANLWTALRPTNPEHICLAIFSGHDGFGRVGQPLQTALGAT